MYLSNSNNGHIAKYSFEIRKSRQTNSKKEKDIYKIRIYEENNEFNI